MLQRFKDFKVSTKIFIGFGLLIFALLFAGYISFQNSKTLIDDTNWVIHTHEVKGNLDEVITNLIDTETGQRGYLITEDKKYLEPYNFALNEIDSNIDNLRRLTLDNPKQQINIDELEPLIQIKLDELQETIYLRNTVGFEAAKELVLSDQGKIVMDDIRELIQNMHLEEDRLLVIRAKLPAESQKNNLILSSWLIMLTIAFSGIVILFITKSIIRPINKLKQGIISVEKGDFNKKVDTGTKDEIGELSRYFDVMTMSIDHKVKIQTKELEGQKSAILNILEDVEAEKQKSVALANDLKKFQLAVANVSDHIVITDPDGIVLYANKASEKTTGFPRKFSIGRKVGTSDTWGGQMEKTFYEKLWHVIKEDKKTFIGEVRNKRKNGDLYDAAVSIAPIIDEYGNVVFFVSIERDITKEKEIDKAKTEFVSLASHQLRTPLSAINWYTEMLLAGDAGKITKEQKKYLDEVYKGNQRMVDLVNSLLNVSRLELGTFVIEPKMTDIIALARSVMDELKSQIDDKKITFNEKHDSDIPEVSIDPKLTRIIIQNLMSNAVKYTPESGNITFNLLMRKKGSKVDSWTAKKDSIFISVADSGIGIPKHQQESIFIKLFRADNVRETDTEGTGLGLYIVKSILDQSGGDVWFESEEGKGTTFYVTIPLAGMKEKKGTKVLNN